MILWQLVVFLWCRVSQGGSLSQPRENPSSAEWFIQCQLGEHLAQPWLHHLAGEGLLQWCKPQLGLSPRVLLLVNLQHRFLLKFVVQPAVQPEHHQHSDLVVLPVV